MNTAIIFKLYYKVVNDCIQASSAFDGIYHWYCNSFLTNNSYLREIEYKETLFHTGTFFFTLLYLAYMNLMCLTQR